MKKSVITKILEWLGLIKYKTRTVHKDHFYTIKRPENDCRLYQKTELEIIMEYHKQGKTDKQIAKIVGRTEGAIRQERWRQRHGY